MGELVVGAFFDIIESDWPMMVTATHGRYELRLNVEVILAFNQCLSASSSGFESDADVPAWGLRAEPIQPLRQKNASSRTPTMTISKIRQGYPQYQASSGIFQGDASGVKFIP